MSPDVSLNVEKSSRENGSPGRARTADPVINSHLLYQLSYRGIPFLKRDGAYIRALGKGASTDVRQMHILAAKISSSERAKKIGSHGGSRKGIGWMVGCLHGKTHTDFGWNP